jgi:hypothetical protein
MKFLRVLLRAANAINTPAEIIDRLNKELNAGLADPKVMA